jgi:GDP-L-fucose synthase
MSKFPVSRDSKVYVAGHRGMVGSAIHRKLKEGGFSTILTRTSAELDLRNRKLVFEFFESEKPEIVFLAAARVGGILANDTYPADFLSDNLQIQVNVMDAANKNDCDRLVFLGSSCIYPKFAPQPIPEEALMTGHLESTNDAYAIAKIAGIKQVQAIRRQYGRKWISVMPSNLYGPGDNYDAELSHVLPALIRRYEDAKISGSEQVTNWGSGEPRRELLYVDDLADASVFLLENFDSDQHINIGTGVDHTIREISEVVAEEVGFSGKTLWDTAKPDGTPQKLLDISKAKSLGWAPKTQLKKGIALAVEDYRKRIVAETKS